MARIIVSAGHTSMDPGMSNGDLREVDLTRKIANATIPYLRSNGLITLSVPPELDLARRIEWINATGYRETLNDIAVEIHINDGGKSGLEGWYKETGNNKSQQLAQVIMDSAIAETGLQNQGLRSEYDHELGTLAFVHNTNPISVLLECLYIDNPEDQKFLRDNEKIDQLGKGIAKGILKFLNIEFKESKLPKPQTTTEVKEPVSSVVSQPATVQSAPAAATVSPQAVTLQNTMTTPIPTTPVAPATQPPPPIPAPRPMVGNDSLGGSSFGGANALGGRSNFGGGGSSFGSPTPIGGGSSFGSTGSSFGAGAAGGSNFMQNREERKKTIEDTYQKVLGRTPNQNDLNYFLNIGITEDQLIKRMIDSQEHADLVKSRSEVVEIKTEHAEQKSRLLEIEAQVKDQEEIIRTLNTLLAEKNGSIENLRNSLRESDAKKRTMKKQSDTTTKSKEEEYKPSFSDRIFKFFSDIFE